MVTGRLPFRGEHEAAILYSVVNEQPKPIEASISDVSPELIHIINRALEKDPAERYKSAEDMLIDLRRLKKETSRTGFFPTRGTKKKIQFFRNKVFISVIAIVLLTATYYLTFIKKGVEINPDHSLSWMNLPFSTIGSGPAISPDGKWIVFGAEDKNKRWDLYTVSLEGGEPRPITHDSSDQVLFAAISPNGTTIVYNQVSRTTYDICIVPFNGGVSKKIAIGNNPLWSPDGKRIGYVLDPIQLSANTSPSGRTTSKSGNGEFWTMNPDGSSNTLEFTDTVAAKNDSRVCFTWSPDGRAVAWLRKNYQEHCEILLHDLITHTERSVVSEGLSAMVDLCWTYNDQIIYSTMINGEMNLRMVPIKGGVPIVITKGLDVVQHPRISADGRTLIFLQNKLLGHLWLAKTDGSGDRTEVKVGGEPYFKCPSISPDGKYITVIIQTLGGAYVRQIFILSRDGSDRHQITTGTVNNLYFWPTWSPDGKKIFYYVRGINEPYDSFRVYVVNVPKIDVPRCLGLGWSTS
jgi:Tol biopolymer transport system component